MNNIKETGGYLIERLCAKNIGDVAKLHAAVYGKLPPAGFFENKYDTAFTGVKYNAFIAYNNQGLPIAFYGVIPCFLRFDDSIVLAAQSADTMTHPLYRNQGLFVELAKRTFEVCCSAGIEILFGFPNQNSLPGFINKLAWQQTETMHCFIIPVSMFSWRRLLMKFSFFRRILLRYRQRQLNKYLVRQNGIANSAIEGGFAGVYRDHHYLKYKTYSATQVIKIGPSTLWVKIGRNMIIGDILAAPDDFNGLVKNLKKLARKLSVKEIHFHSSPGTALHHLFAVNYTPKPSFPVIFKYFTGGNAIDNVKFTFADIDIF
ncbi:hypothetical protein BH09BAC6_BH09BAC6_11740 [soil metagenome]|jgi:hypothetical protein